MGYRILQTNGQTPQVDLDATTEDSYTIRRYLTGVGEGQEELLRETALPQESNMDIMNGIDFHKGCYVGQELTIRTKHRGVVRKRILPCMIYPKTSPMPTSLAYDPSSEAPGAETIPAEKSIGRFEKRGRSAGKWLRGMGNVGLALCRLETMTDVVLPGETAAAGYSAEDEFVLEWGGEGVEEAVKIKAFVPEWLRAGLDAQR
jgi:folate-binding protein YgfZ